MSMEISLASSCRLSKVLHLHVVGYRSPGIEQHWEPLAIGYAYLTASILPNVLDSDQRPD